MDPAHNPGPILGLLILFGSFSVIVAVAVGWMWLKERFTRKRE